MTDLTNRPGQGFSFMQQPLPSVRPSWELSEERLQREDATSTGDYVGSMTRQDGIVDPLMAHIVGQQMSYDPNYTAYVESEWKDLTEGVWPEYHKEFGAAHSAAHARFMKDRILQKQEDLTRLGDLGVPGTLGRLALGVVSPENLAFGVIGGYATKGLRAIQLSRATRAGASVVTQAANRAEAVATVAGRAGRAPAVAAGVGVGAAENAAFEAYRQSINFEDDDLAVLEAALIGGAFTAPFALAGARAELRVAEAAKAEHTALKALSDLNEGKPLTPESARVLERVVKSQEIAKEVELGRMTPAQAFEQLSGFQGPRMPDAVWLDRMGDDLRTRGEALLDEMFPSRVTERTRQRLMPEEAPLQLGYDPAVQGSRFPIQVTAGGQAVPGALTKADIETAIRDAAAKRFPKDPAKADQWAMEQRAAQLGYKAEVATKVATAKAEKAPAAKVVEDPAAVLTGDTPAPAAPRTIAVEDVVDWKDKATGEDRWGMVESIREDGWYMVRDDDGKVTPLHPSRVTQAPPEGFLGGSIGAAQVAELKEVVRGDTAMRKLRVDYFSILDRSESQGVRDLAFLLIKDPIQSDVAQGMTASEWKSHIRRTVGGAFHVESRLAAREAAEKMGIPFWARAKFNAEFHELVSRLTRGDLSVTMVNKDMAPMLQRASAAQKEMYRKLLEEAKAVGVKGTEELDFNEFYVPRVWHHRNIQAAIDRHGADAVHRLLATAINVPGFIGDVDKAAKFLFAVRKLEFSKVLQNVHLHAQDMGTLRNLLQKEGLADDQVNVVVDAMFTAKERDGADTGRMGNLKYRFDINETLSVNTPQGVLRISDLFENDARVLADQYLNTLGGHIALAKVGIRSEADFQARLAEVQDEAIKKGLKGIDKDQQYLQDIHANITGRPMSTQDFSGTARVASALRGYTRSVSLGQLGLTAAFEMKQAVGLMGFRAFYQQLPSFRGLIDAMRNGHIPDAALARDIMHMTGFGTEMSSSYARAQEIDDGFLGQSLMRVEDFANKASHLTDLMSGNASFTSLTRQFSGMMASQRAFDFASGRLTGRLGDDFRARAVGWGVDADSLDNLMDSYKRHTKASAGGKVETIEWEKWLRDEPGYYHQFQTLVSRMARDAIQDQDLGEMIPFMHQSLGKVFGELKTFFFVAHAKNMLKNLHYRDATAFQVWAISFIGEMLAYTTQASVNNAHDPEKLQELLRPETIAAAAFFRSPVNGMVPFFAETSYQLATGGESLVSPDMTASGNGRLLAPPALQAIQRLYAAPSTGTGLLLGNGNVTEREGLNLWKTLPLSNMLGARNLGALLVEALPDREQPSD